MTNSWKEKKAKSKDEGFTLTIANAVFKYLNALVDDRPKRRTRWIWELLQNAHDASTASHKRLVASIMDNSKELVFFHNGSGFTMEQIQRLIFHGSTKVEDEETIGRYGSGFLTTHLLSWDIDVSGQLEDGQWFDFRLSRNPESVNALSTSMNQAWDDFNPVSSLREPMPESFTTRFKYPITEIWAKDAVKEGNTTLKQCAPFVVVFNKAFYSINIKEPLETRAFKVVQRCLSIRSGISEINVVENINGNQTEMRYLLAQGKKASVAVRMTSIGGYLECLSVENIPRLFVAFPLMGTESFSFPAVINGNRKFFKPNENRDGVDIGQGNYLLDTETNRNNQAVIKEACTLLVYLFQHASSNGWHHAYRWAEIPPIQENEWLRKCIKEKFIENILQTPAILTQFDKVIGLKDAVLPLPKSVEGVKALWDLLNNWSGHHEKLPRQNEAIGWWNSIESWTDIDGIDTSMFNEAIDDQKLASQVEDCSGIDNLQKLLRENVCAVDWLNRLYEFLKIYRIPRVHAAIDNYALVPNQVGEFDLLENLYCDKDIDNELKKIAELLGWSLREELRDTRLTALEDEVGNGDWDNKYVVNDLIRRLQKRVEKNPDSNFKKATTRLFAWVVRQDQKNYWDNFRDIPVFTEDGKFHHSLRSASPNSTPPLAPVCAWSKELQEFSDLFPASQILTPDFFEVLPEPDEWRKLNEKKFVRLDMDIIIRETKQVDFQDFCPKDELDESDDREHRTADCISVTDVAQLSGIMAPLRDNKKLAVLFWRFLTEWLMKKDAQGVEIKTAKCSICAECHEYYSAAWLKPVRDNHWVQRAPMTSKLLANLLRDTEWKLGSLDSDAVKLLKAIGESPSDFRFEFMAGNLEERDAVVHTMTELHQAFGGDLGPIDALLDYAQNNENLPQDLEKVLEATGGDLSQVVEDIGEHKEQQDRMDENRHFGKQVENWVKQILEQNLSPKGFSVTPKHTGSDLEILPETFDISTQEIIQNEKTWLVEVKGTRVQNVKLSFEQTKNALDESQEFLLCVVPIPEDTEPKFETVRDNMRFIKNIRKKLGNRVASLCNSIDGQKAVMDNTPDDTAPGINLDFEKGKAGIRVNKSLWEDEKIGFPLKKLAENLK